MWVIPHIRISHTPLTAHIRISHTPLTTHIRISHTPLTAHITALYQEDTALYQFGKPYTSWAMLLFIFVGVNETTDRKCKPITTRSVCTLQHTAIHCNSLQHTATHGNSLQHKNANKSRREVYGCCWMAHPQTLSSFLFWLCWKTIVHIYIYI